MPVTQREFLTVNSRETQIKLKIATLEWINYLF